MSEIETVTPETPAEQPANTNTGKNGKPKKSAKREALEWVLTIVAALAIAFVIRTFLFEPVRVDGGSMLETLQDGEIMFVTKFDYLGSNPDRFDVVICHYPNRGTTNFVKRVVGLPGDTVEILAKQNGWVLLRTADGRYGWAAGELLRETADAPAATATPAAPVNPADPAVPVAPATAAPAAAPAPDYTEVSNPDLQ